MPLIPGPNGERPDADTATADPAETTETFDRDALAEKISDQFNAVLSGEDPPEPEDEDVLDPDDNDDVVVDDENDEQEAASDDFEVEDPDGESDDDPADPAPDTDLDTDDPTLPDAYRRSLYAYGLDDEQINKDFERLGPQYVEIARRIHDGRNAETARQAEIGRLSRKLQGDQQSTQQSGGEKPSDKLNIDALKDKYGDDELIEEIVAPFKAILDEQQQTLEEFRQAQQSQKQENQVNLERTVTDFFTDKEMKPYEDLYGSSQPTQDQWAKRNEVLETAEALVLGAEVQGRTLNVPDALKQAHDLVAQDHKTTAVRSKITKEAKSRGRGKSLKPSRSKGPASDKKGPPDTRTDLEKRTAERLKAAGLMGS